MAAVTTLMAKIAHEDAEKRCQALQCIYELPVAHLLPGVRQLLFELRARRGLQLDLRLCLAEALKRDDHRMLHFGRRRPRGDDPLVEELVDRSHFDLGSWINL